MNRAEVAQLFALIVRVDSRRKAIGENPLDVVEAWTPILNPLGYQAAVSAVHKHYTNSEESIMPVHIIRLANAERNRTTHWRDDECGVPHCRCTHTDPCVNGWIELEPPGPTSHGLVRRCPNCTPVRTG